MASPRLESEPGRSRARSLVPQRGLERSRVLIVDDQPDNLRTLAGVLAPLDAEVIAAASTDEALRAVLQHEFAVILLDVQMPDTDGLDLARMIKSRQASRLTPIIFITALDRDRRNITAGFESGAVDYLFKPIDPGLTRAKVAAFIQLYQRREEESWRQRRRYADLADEAVRETTERVAERTRRLQRVTAALSGALTPEQVAGVVVEHGVAALAAQAGSILRLTADRTALDLTRAVGYPASALADWSRVPIESPWPVAEAARTGRPIFIESDAEWRVRYPRRTPVSSLPDSQSWAVLPLVTNGRVLGVMGLSFSAPGPFDPDERAFMTTLAQQCAQALERARLYAEAERVRGEAEAARRSAEEANRAKSEFLATMSHELRTPLNALVGYVQLLDMGVAGPITPQQREYLGRLGASSQHLLALVNDVLDVAKVDAGRLAVAREQAIAGDAVAAAVAIIAPQATARDVRLADLPENCGGVSYVGDEDRVRQILINLLGNGVKFTEPGGVVSATCGTEPRAPAGAMLHGEGPWAFIRITDTGIGIPLDQRLAVFEPFHQLETGRTRTTSGTGLGLAISRRLARLMGGDLTLDDAADGGSSFTLWLPASEASESAGARGARSEPRLAAPRARGLGQIGEMLRENLEEIIRSYVERLQGDPATPLAAGMRAPQVEDHALSLASDLAQSLIIVADGGEEGGALLRDGSAIQRTIAEHHGRRRQAQGWSEDAVRHDYGVLREEIERAIRARAPADSGDLPEASEILGRLMERAEAISVRAWRQAAHREQG